MPATLGHEPPDDHSINDRLATFQSAKPDTRAISSRDIRTQARKATFLDDLDNAVHFRALNDLLVTRKIAHGDVVKTVFVS